MSPRSSNENRPADGQQMELPRLSNMAEGFEQTEGGGIAEYPAHWSSLPNVLNGDAKALTSLR